MLTLYNTLTNKKEVFTSQEKGKVKMYSCGPTVYDYAHIGNLTAYIYADLLRRYLEYSGFEVRQIMNITDVGHLTDDDINQADSGQDKMLKASLRENKNPIEIAKFYTQQFLKDAKKLNLEKASYYPRATAHVTQMIKLIETLIKKGLAYEKNGNVFFAVKKFKTYGKLSNKKITELIKACRLDEHPDKKECFDFVLWLKAPKKHLMQWDSPWGKGYPGWHIECSAMSMEYLGETLDLHTGGEDHIFPHHENEIAQSEGYTGKTFAHFWFHNRFLLVDGGKMSKSKKNFYTLKDILAKGYRAMDFRIFVLSSHYRSNINFTWQSMNQARTNLRKIERFIDKLNELNQAEVTQQTITATLFDITPYQKRFEEAMEDDLNSPLALSVLYDLISAVNKKISNNKLTLGEIKNLLTFWKKINLVLGLQLKKRNHRKDIPQEVKNLLKKRKNARIEKNFEEADKFRAEIKKLGFTVEDTPKGQKIDDL